MKEMGEKAKQENKKRIREGGACLFFIPYLNIPTYTLCITQLHTLFINFAKAGKERGQNQNNRSPTFEPECIAGIF